MFIKKKQQGFTLVEVLASLVIITIILLSFFSFFISTAKTTKTSSTIFDATYYAQKEMEELYNITQSTLIKKNDTNIKKEKDIILAVSRIGFKQDVDSFTKEGEVFNYRLKIKYEDLDRNLTRFTIYACEKGKACENAAIKAQMESIYEWRLDNEDT
ncbi:prepilin-type N-terminal cleavage/methylation domain-containing protein [Lysinibacillus agricola]|uniref:Prepilin-type N-terminal cleavage/methylation domain-containing protein n=1 Tax=Lysinibacillus agricola TaxID=2590012 RepID=A0ABX7AY09_9BACI|nr:prepilin-type N-terminal cleavage/methylation domain-containing protein [Lysinibacillus agricola]QQP13758.1 prepilin-type N-terminal cleavage/methylation domain-containing protein [Lysinibacillus agricola]